MYIYIYVQYVAETGRTNLQILIWNLAAEPERHEPNYIVLKLVYKKLYDQQ